MLSAKGIFDFCSETAELDLTKLDRKQDLNVFYQVCVFRVNQKTRMAALADLSTNVTHCTQLHDMWPFGPLLLPNWKAILAYGLMTSVWFKHNLFT